MQLITIYDNKAKGPFLADWGLSCLVREFLNKGDILFDTGTKEKILESNANLLKIDKEKIKYCFISHDHHDHIGGLGWLSSKTKIFYPGEYHNEIENISTIILGSSIGLIEQSLVIQKENKKVLLAGCSHPEIEKIARKAFNLVGKMDLVVGGFHLFSEPDESVKNTAKRLKELTEKIAPCHCTGDEAEEIFKDVFQENYVENFAGNIIEI
jgi:7,8-dihydropterin-6-yl-methyl-4-(beta-D-ribofuranosyl)aminobenzene 5'-phosphate synthase